MTIGIPEIFRIASIFMGLFIGYFTYRIYVLTKGGSKGWKYMAISGVALCFWAIFQVTFSFFIPIKIFRVIAGIFFFPLIAIFGLLTPIVLLRDMEVDKPRWFSRRNAIIYSLIIFTLLITYNFLLRPWSDFSLEILSIVFDLIPFLFIFSAYGFYILMRRTKNNVWTAIYLGNILVAVGTLLISFTANCCGDGESLVNLEECQGYRYDYVHSIPLPCIPYFLPFIMNGSIFILIGILLYLVTFYNLWKPMQETHKHVIEEKKIPERIMRNIVSETISETLNFTGKIVGKSLAIRLTSKPLERIEVMYADEIEHIGILDDGVKIKFKKDISEEKMYEILETSLSEIEDAYSKIIGAVGRTMTRKGLLAVTKKYENKYPNLKKVLGEDLGFFVQENEET